VKPVVLARLARREILAATSLYEARKPGLGAEFTDRIAEAVERIRVAPDGYQIGSSHASYRTPDFAGIRQDVQQLSRIY
jgi:hypothetical protein